MTICRSLVLCAKISGSLEEGMLRCGMTICRSLVLCAKSSWEGAIHIRNLSLLRLRQRIHERRLKTFDTSGLPQPRLLCQPFANFLEISRGGRRSANIMMDNRSRQVKESSGRRRQDPNWRPHIYPSLPLQDIRNAITIAVNTSDNHVWAPIMVCIYTHSCHWPLLQDIWDTIAVAVNACHVRVSVAIEVGVQSHGSPWHWRQLSTDYVQLAHCLDGWGCQIYPARLLQNIRYTIVVEIGASYNHVCSSIMVCVNAYSCHRPLL
mmetsp:Transcript_743/g.1487  ORF Transcript_743/g.1487 Transcript_743/m.1487 type:complete len:264 (+) Transcript_743:2-793(+)